MNLPRENVFGHTKKVALIRSALSRLRAARGRGLRILDVGCGNGSAVTRYLGEPGDDVVGLDVHAPSIVYATEHFANAHTSFALGSIESATHLGVFDAIVFADVLEHVDAPGAFLSAARRLLADRGRILITIPNGRGPFEIESAVARTPYVGRATLWLADLIVAVANKWIVRGAWSRVASPDGVPYNHESGHVQFFTFRRFVALTGEAGFDLATSRNLSLLSGAYTNYFFAPSALFCRANNWVADRVPRWIASAWFFELEADAATGTELTA